MSLISVRMELKGLLYQKATKITVHIFKNNCSIRRSKYSLTDSIISLSQEISLITNSFSLQSDRAVAQIISICFDDPYFNKFWFFT